MEANRDDAKRCLNKAKAAHRLGDFERAQKLALKSNKLYPTKECEGKHDLVLMVVIF